MTVSGDGVYTASFTPLAIGEYTWVANYSGDSPNTNPFGPTACPDSNEAVIVIGRSFSATAQDWLPNDTATLTGDTNLNGTLTFTLYPSADCTGTPVPNQSYIVPVVDAVVGFVVQHVEQHVQGDRGEPGFLLVARQLRRCQFDRSTRSVRDVDGDDHRLS